LSLAIFDLDNTLLNGDSEQIWWAFLADRGFVSPESFDQQRADILAKARSAPLDIMAYVEVSVKSFTLFPKAELEALRRAYVQTCIAPRITASAKAVLEYHRENDDYCLIITATNRFLAEPIADLLAVDDLIATEREMKNGTYTGCVTGTPSFREGKVSRLERWQKDHDFDLKQSHFYTDSHHDLLLLKQVGHPVVVDPDPELRMVAKAKNWPIRYLK